MANVELMLGDCLERMREIPDGSVNLILTDPPYFKVKGEQWDNQWAEPMQFLAWLDDVLIEFARVLHQTGSVYIFASPQMSSRVEILMSERFNILSNIVWNKKNAPGFDGWKQKMRKESLRKFYPHSERVIFAEPIGVLPDYSATLRAAREKVGMTQAGVCELFGFHGKTNRGGMLANWELGLSAPSTEQWSKLKSVLDLPDFYNVVRPFRVTANVPYTDVWEFETVRPYAGKHPCEKPATMLEHIINASSLRGDLVLDAFMGTGSTGIASKTLGRNFVGIEQDEKYFNIAKKRIEAAQQTQGA